MEIVNHLLNEFIDKGFRALKRGSLGIADRVMICGSNLYDTNKEDRRKRYPTAWGVDAIDGPGVDVVGNLEDALMWKGVGKFAHIECVSMLEHCRRPWLAARTMSELLLPGGTVVVAAPFSWRLHAYPDDYFRFTLSGLKSLFEDVEWVLEAYQHSGRIDYKCKVPKMTDEDGNVFIGRTEAWLFGRKL